jgi:mRNA interferase MazF
MVRRGEVYLVELDPTVGSEVKKTRPCLVVSPDEMNEFLNTVIVAPMTTKGFVLPSRISITYGDKKGWSFSIKSAPSINSAFKNVCAKPRIRPL